MDGNSLRGRTISKEKVPKFRRRKPDLPKDWSITCFSRTGPHWPGEKAADLKSKGAQRASVNAWEHGRVLQMSKGSCCKELRNRLLLLEDALFYNMLGIAG